MWDPHISEKKMWGGGGQQSYSAISFSFPFFFFYSSLPFLSPQKGSGTGARPEAGGAAASADGGGWPEAAADPGYQAHLCCQTASSHHQAV